MLPLPSWHLMCVSLATGLVSLLWKVLHGTKHFLPLGNGRLLVNLRIQYVFFLVVVLFQRVPQEILFLIALRILLLHLFMEGLKKLTNLPVLLPHLKRRTKILHAGLPLKERKQDLFLPNNMALQAKLKLLEEFLCLCIILFFQLLEFPKIAIKLIVVLTIKRCDFFFHAFPPFLFL